MASASTSTSTASVQKQSVSSNGSRTQPQGNILRRQSYDTVCSSNSSCILQRKKPAHPLSVPLRGVAYGGNVIRQRLLSAKAAKLKSVQNQLNDANFHLSELLKENRALKTLQKRQDKALKDYEGVEAELPRMIKTYEEEIRVMREKNKGLKKTVKDMTEKLKAKDEELNSLQDQLRYLILLSKDKHLGERQKLKEELEDAREKLKSSQADISVLNRKLLLENKSSKFRISNESTKVKQCQKELTQALAEIDRLNTLLESNRMMKTRRLPRRQTTSCISLGSASTPELNDLPSDESVDKQEKLSRSCLKSPTESIKIRLASGETESSRPSTSQKLNALSEKLENSVQKPINKEMDPMLGDYCVDVVESVKTMNTIVDDHKKDFIKSTNTAQITMENLKQSDDKLKRSEDLDLVDKIWNEEFSFKKNSNSLMKSSKETAAVSHEEKRKLLAALKAIDAGESIEKVDGTFSQNSKMFTDENK